MSITKRVAILVNKTRTTRKELSEAMKVSKQYVSGLLTGRNSIGLRVVRFLLDYYPGLNANWLIKGDGEMFINSDKLPNVEEDLAEYKSIKVKYYELLEENRVLRMEIENMEKKKK